MQALVVGSRSDEKNCVELIRSHNAEVIVCFFRREISHENAVGSGGGSGRGEFLETHLKDGIVVAEEDERNLRRFANVADQIENAVQRGAGLEGALGGALDGGAIGERIAEGDAKFDYVGASFGEGEDEFEGGGQGGIARGDVGDDAHLAGRAELGKATRDTTSDGCRGGHGIAE